MLRRLLPLLFLAALTLQGAPMEHAMAPLDLRAFAANAPVDALAPGMMVPNFRLNDHNGTTRELYYETSKAVVLVFTARGSNRALATSQALRALRARYPAREVVIWQVESGAAASGRSVAAEQALYNDDTPVLMDEAQLLATELGATRELETFVLGGSPFWLLAYRGPLDNADPDSLEAPTLNHTARAIDAVLAGQLVAGPAGPMSARAPALNLPPSPAIDYAADVAPIVMRRCVSCHSPGGIAPHAYTAFEDLSRKTTAIRASVLEKRMAPWHADPQYGVFSNGVGLTPAEAATLHAWARAGGPRGNGPDPLAAAPVSTSPDWPLGTPDLIVTLPKQDLPATGLVEYKYLTAAVPVPEDRWLRAAVVRPGNSRVVHHALVFEGGLLDVLLAGGGLGGFFAGYVPGLQQTFFPEGTGKLIRKSGLVTAQMHYTTTGQVESDQTQIGFYFASTPPARELLTRAASTTSITIPPGNAEYASTATFTPSARNDVMLYELNPHMHYRGKRFRFEALYPNGTSEVLLNVPQYDFAWQSQYRLAEPKRLPAGTQIRASGAFDNSAQNRMNPDPRATVRFGEQTNDEMFIGYVNYAELTDRPAAAAPAYPVNLTARARVGEAFRLDVTAAGATAYAASGLPAGLQLAGGVITGTPRATGRHAVVVSASNAAGRAAVGVDLQVTPATGAPVFTRQPASIRARLGETVTLTAEVTASPAPTYTWYFRGGEFCNTDSPSLTLANVTAAHVGEYLCVAQNSSGAARSASASLSLDFTGLVNLSARANVGTSSNVLISGITVRGDRPKTLLIRAAGPALAGFGVPGTLANPVVSVFDTAGQKLLVNDNWGDAPNAGDLLAAIRNQGAFAFPDGSRDSALLVTLPPGGYSVQVTGAGTGTAAQGVSAVEVYEADAAPSTLVNLSCRARVGTGADVLIAGFVVRGNAPRRLLVRAVGPTLNDLGLTGTLADPKLVITAQSGGAVVAENDNWDASLAPTFAAVGAFALRSGSRDAALVLTLPPGGYTATVSGVGNTTGIAIVEVYDLP